MANQHQRLVKAVRKKLVEETIFVKESITPTNRFERIGTIFSRTTGLIKSEAMKKEDIPIWYHVYQAFPPKYEPQYARPPVPNVKVHNILYPEDKLRSAFYKGKVGRDTAINIHTRSGTLSQQFILKYHLYKATCDTDKSEDETINEFLEKEKVNVNKS